VFVFLAAKDEVVARLTAMNALDIKLWEYAMFLVQSRAEYVNSEAFAANNKGNDQCSGRFNERLAPELQRSIGIFRPVGHKGPF
jgi:hypothetical protein